MLRFPPIRVVPWLLATLLSTSAAAQTVSSTTGAINGRVTDNTNAVLPGVTVTISSPSMMGTRSAATSEDGMYRFAAVPPGEYTIAFELAGFSTVKRENVRVGLGFTATINVELALASVTENVTVSGASPVVDTQSTAITTNFDAKQLAALPSARDMWAILAESPAVSLTRIDVGGSAAGTQTTYIVYGTQGQNRPTVEGIIATEGTDAAGFYYDYGSFDEVNVETAAHSAEMPWPGVQSQFVAKSGGNQYHGGVYQDYENKSIQSVNVDQQQIALGLAGGPGLPPDQTNRASAYRDTNADIGGYLKKDKLWWYGSFRDEHVAAQYANFPVKPHVTDLLNYSGKGTYQLSTNNKLIGFVTANRKHQPTRLDSFLLGNTTDINTSAISTWEQLYWAWVWKGEWNSVINEKLFFELRGGQFGYNWPNYATGSQTRFEDLGNNIVSGSNRNWERDRRRNQLIGSMSYFKDGWAGSHNFKFGGEAFRETVNETWLDGYPGDVVQVLNNGQPLEVYLFQTPSTSLNGLWTYSAYANDVWRVSSKLTLNIGARFDRYRAFLPPQTHPAGRFNPTAQDFAANEDVIHFNLPSPRIGATYDIGGNGKTVVKFNYGEYWWNPGADFLLTGVNPNPNVWYNRYAWSDANGNGVWDPGEQGRLIASKGGPSQLLDPGLQDTYTKETAVWFEHEVMNNFGVRTGVVWRGQRQRYQSVNVSQPFAAFNVPVSVVDPGPDGRTGTADDGAAIQTYNLNPAYLGIAPKNVTENVPGKDDYYTWEITANKRLSNHWSMLGSYAITWNRDNNSTYFGQTVRQNSLPVAPADLINTDNGRYDFTTSTAKISGTYEGPWGLKITPIWRFQAGQPFGRTFVARLNYASVRILAEPFDARHQDNISIFDTRLEKVFRFAGSRQISGFFDLFNITNQNPAQNITWSSGTTFLRPLSIVPPRIARIGAKLSF